MSLPSPPYQTFARVCIQQEANFTQWQKTAEADKLLDILVDQLDARNSIATRNARLQALTEYLGIKRTIASDSWFDNMSDIVLREKLISHTLTNSLTRFDQNQFGICGRFHRVLQQVLNETDSTGGGSSEQAIFQIWTNGVVLGINEHFEYDALPVAAATTGYRVNANAVIENTGDLISIDADDRLRLYSFGIGLTSQIWQIDEVDIVGAEEDILNLDPTVVGDTGVYRNSFTNDNGTTYGPEFNVSVT